MAGEQRWNGEVGVEETDGIRGGVRVSGQKKKVELTITNFFGGR